GALLAGGSLAAHLGQYRALDAALAPGLVGGALLVLAQLAYVPNAVGWAICYSLGPGFAFGTSTVVAPTGAALGPLPLFPMLAALPTGTAGVPGWISAGVLALPYAAGVVGGILVARASPTPAVEVAPLWGFACGVATGCVIGVFAAFSGGPLGGGRLAAVGPSGWQAALVAVLEGGVSAAGAAGPGHRPPGGRAPRRAARRGAAAPGGAGGGGRAGCPRGGPGGARRRTAPTTRGTGSPWPPGRTGPRTGGAAAARRRAPQRSPSPPSARFTAAGPVRSRWAIGLLAWWHASWSSSPGRARTSRRCSMPARTVPTARPSWRAARARAATQGAP